MTSVDEQALDSEQQRALRRISVERLFGRYSYDLLLNADEAAESRLTVIYGDNGSGKTTILKALFHLLSPAPNRRHRGALARLPFGSFSVEFIDGTTVYAARAEGRFLGDYLFGIRRGGEPIAETLVRADEDGDVISKRNEGLDDVVSILGPATPDVYYIADDRRVLSDRLGYPDDTEMEYLIGESRRTIVRHVPQRARQVDLRDIDPRDIDLTTALDRAIEWIRRQAIGASNVGTESANTIYADVTRKVAAPSPFEAEQGPVDQDAMISRLKTLDERSREYEEFGLAPGFRANELIVAVRAADPERRATIWEILAPYLESVEARLRAVSDLQSRLSTFVRRLNSFYSDKFVRVKLPRGIEVLTSDGDPLPPTALSSGEKHLLLILASTFYAQERDSLFIIDEPELSLNMKWQRTLLDALMECTAGGATQFILASHSFEILSGHEDRVVALTPLEPPRDE